MTRSTRARDLVIAAIAGFIGGALLAVAAGPVAAVLSGAAGAGGALIAVCILTPRFGAIDWGFAAGFTVIAAGGIVLYSLGQSRWPSVAPWLLPLWFWTSVPPFIGLIRWRAKRRIKRGLCPKCAYPVGTNQVCTECGAAVHQ